MRPSSCCSSTRRSGRSWSSSGRYGSSGHCRRRQEKSPRRRKLPRRQRRGWPCCGRPIPPCRRTLSCRPWRDITPRCKGLSPASIRRRRPQGKHGAARKRRGARGKAMNSSPLKKRNCCSGWQPSLRRRCPPLYGGQHPLWRQSAAAWRSTSTCKPAQRPSLGQLSAQAWRPWALPSPFWHAATA